MHRQKSFWPGARAGHTVHSPVRAGMQTGQISRQRGLVYVASKLHFTVSVIVRKTRTRMQINRHRIFRHINDHTWGSFPKARLFLAYLFNNLKLNLYFFNENNNFFVQIGEMDDVHAPLEKISNKEKFKSNEKIINDNFVIKMH